MAVMLYATHARSADLLLVTKQTHTNNLIPRLPILFQYTRMNEKGVGDWE